MAYEIKRLYDPTDTELRDFYADGWRMVGCAFDTSRFNLVVFIEREKLKPPTIDMGDVVFDEAAWKRDHPAPGFAKGE